MMQRSKSTSTETPSQAPDGAFVSHVAANNKSLRVLSIGAEWLPEFAGGLNVVAHGLAHALAERGVRQDWLVVGNGPFEEGDRVHVKPVAPIQSHLLARFRAMREAFSSAIQTPPHLVTSHFALYAYPVRRAVERYPYVVHFQGPWYAEARAEGSSRWKSWIQYCQERAVYKRADRLIVLSAAFSRILSDTFRVPEELIRVIPPGLDVKRFQSGLSRESARNVLGLSNSRPIVCCVRRLARRMGLEMLIDAMAQVVEKHPDTLLVIAGKGNLDAEIRERIQSRNLTRSVLLLGFVPDEQLPLLYRSSDLSVVPTQFLEGFGLITIESLAAGTPVLVTPIGGLPDAVGGLSKDLVLESADADDIAMGIIEALSGVRQMPDGTACSSFARDNYDWTIIARRVLEVYQEAIDAHG